MKKLAISLLIIGEIILIASILWCINEANAPFKAAHITRPPGAKLLYKEHKWSNVGGGYSVWVYRLPQKFYENLYKDCRAMNLKEGTYKDSSIESSILDRFLILNGQGCYQVDKKSNQIIVTQFEGNKLAILVVEE